MKKKESNIYKFISLEDVPSLLFSKIRKFFSYCCFVEVSKKGDRNIQF